MTPLIDGALHHFVLTGVYDGLFVMRDVETKTLWNHMTGEAMYGPLVGRSMPLTNLLQTSVKQALALDPEMDVAISSRPITGPGNRLDPGATLSAKFIETLAKEDERRPRMELGLGVVVGNHRRYYPLKMIQERGAFVDSIDGRRVLVYLDDGSFTPGAVFDENGGVDVARVRAGAQLTDRQGQPLTRPLQLFTRWYGFSLTFPNCEIFSAPAEARP